MRLLLLLPVLVQAVKRDRGTPTPDHARAWFGLHADQELQMQLGHHDEQRRNLHDWLLGDNYEACCSHWWTQTLRLLSTFDDGRSRTHTTIRA